MTNARVATRVANSKAAKKTDSKVKAPPKVVGKVAKKKAAKPFKLTREYIEKNNLARPGESWDEAFQRLVGETRSS